jgi:hypothetical protein
MIVMFYHNRCLKASPFSSVATLITLLRWPTDEQMICCNIRKHMFIVFMFQQLHGQKCFSFVSVRCLIRSIQNNVMDFSPGNLTVILRIWQIQLQLTLLSTFAVYLQRRLVIRHFRRATGVNIKVPILTEGMDFILWRIYWTE